MKGRWPQIGRIAAAIGLFLLASSSARVVAATTERLVVDPHTGLALGGVDPVAYFTDGQMLKGSPDFELSAQGAVWRFRNEDNRTFFAAAPQIYAPQFGGYDPVDVARGVAVAGQPRLWLIHDKRLYLFSREGNRDAFAAGADAVIRAAVASWPSLRETLAR